MNVNLPCTGTAPKGVWPVLFGAFGFGVRSGSCGSKYFDRLSGFGRFDFHFSGVILPHGCKVGSEICEELQKIE